MQILFSLFGEEILPSTPYFPPWVRVLSVARRSLREWSSATGLTGKFGQPGLAFLPGKQNLCSHFPVEKMCDKDLHYAHNFQSGYSLTSRTFSSAIFDRWQWFMNGQNLCIFLSLHTVSSAHWGCHKDKLIDESHQDKWVPEKHWWCTKIKISNLALEMVWEHSMVD